MKNSLVLILIFISNASHATCKYQDLLKFNLDDLKSLTPLNCADIDEMYSKDDICNCAKENLTKIQYSPKQFKNKATQKDILAQAELGLASLTDDIFLLSDDKSLNGIDLSESCDVGSRLDPKMAKGDKVYQCNGVKKPLMSEKERKDKAKRIAANISKEIAVKSNPRDSNTAGKAFIDRRQNQNNCPPKQGNHGPTDQFMADVNKHMVESRLTNLSQVLTERKNNIEGVKTLNELGGRLLGSDSDYPAEKKIILSNLYFSLKSDPLMNHLINSEAFFGKLKASNFDPKQVKGLVQSLRTNTGTKADLKKNIENKCAAVFKSVNKALCVGKDDNLLPSDMDQVMTSFNVRYDINKTADLMQMSSDLKQNYCNQTKPSEFDVVKDLITPTLRPGLVHGQHAPKTALDDEYKRSTLNNANLICDLIEPPLKDLDKAMKEACGQGNKATPFEPKCLLLKATKAKIKPVYDEEVRKVKALAETKAQEKAERTGKPVSKAEKAKILEKLMKGIDTDSIMEAYADYKAELKGPKNILRDFLGLEKSISNIGGKSNPDSEFKTSAEQQRLTDASLAITGGDSQALRDLRGVMEEETPAERIHRDTQENMDNFYNEVADRITNFSKNPSAAQPPKGGTASATPSITDYMASPYPPSDTDYAPEEYYADANGATINNNFFSAPVEDEAADSTSGPEAAVETTEQRKKREYNRALANNPYAVKGLKRGKPTMKEAPPVVSVSGIEGALSAAGSPELEIPNGDLDQVLGDVEKNLLDAINNGVVDGDNVELAKQLKKLLNKKSFVLVSKENKNHKVRVIKQRRGSQTTYRVVAEGNQADPSYKAFVKKITRSLTIKDKFKTFLTKLDSLLENGRLPAVQAPEDRGRFDNFQAAGSLR